jgi:hypothetical protein
VSECLGESEQKLAQPGFARQAVIAKPTSRSKSKGMAALFSGATLALGIFFALTSQKAEGRFYRCWSGDPSVIVHDGRAYQGAVVRVTASCLSEH